MDDHTNEAFTTVAGVIRAQARIRGDRAAVRCDGNEQTFDELDRRSNQVAAALLAAGVQPQERVAFLDKNGPEYFEVLYGAAKVNAVTVGVNWRLAPAELAFVIDDCEARVLVVGPELAAVADELRPQLPRLEQVIVIGADDERDYDRWLAPHVGAADPAVPSAPGDVAMQVYTSGTTGQPKGAMLTNESFSFLVPRVGEAWRFGPDSVNLVVMPLFHVSGGGWALVGMHRGALAILQREVVPADILRAIEVERVTVAALVISVVQFLMMDPACASTDFSSLELIAYGGSPPPREAMLRAVETFGCDFVQLYGMTEACGAVCALPPEDHDPDGPNAQRLLSCGKPYPWVELRVVDPESGDEVPVGETGEICVRSPQVMLGYWRQPEETAAVLDADGWFHTGDAGKVDEDGYVYLLDRVKDMIISGGENVYPAEVENVLMDHPGIADVALIGVPDERWGETPKALVIAAEGHDPDDALAKDIISFSRDRLAHYKCPTSVDYVAALPRNAAGKVLKRDLRAPFWAGRDRRI